MSALTLLCCLGAVQAAPLNSVQLMPQQLHEESGPSGTAPGLKFAQVDETPGDATSFEWRQGGAQARPSSEATDEIEPIGVSAAVPGDARRFPSPHCDNDGVTDRSPITDYAGQRYLLAFKLAGFGRLRETPLRLLEVHAGYYARGFTKEEEDRGDPLRRRLFAGVGLNVGELLFPRRRSSFARGARSFLEWVQLPYTAAHGN